MPTSHYFQGRGARAQASLHFPLHVQLVLDLASIFFEYFKNLDVHNDY